MRPMEGPALRGVPLLAGLLVFFPTLALYARTVMGDVATWDTAEFQTLGPVLGIAHPTGYPSYTLLAWLASVVLQPLGEPALRANFMSAILAAGAAGLTAASVVVLGGRALIGIAAGSALAVTTVTWSIGLRADAHALHLALVGLLLLLLALWAQREQAARPAGGLLLTAAFVFAVSLGNHALTLLLAPGIGIYVLAVSPRLMLQRPRLVVAAALVLGLTTAALYAYLPLRSAMEPPLDYANPETWEGFRYLVFAEQFRGSFDAVPPPIDAVRLVASETLAELGVFALLGVVGGLVSVVRRPQLLLLLLSWFVLSWAFALAYSNADIERYRLAPLLAVAVLGGLGANDLLDAAVAGWRRWRRNRPVPPPSGERPRGNAGRVTTAFGLSLLLLAPTLHHVSQRFEQLDQSGPTFGRLWLEAILPQLEPRAVVVSWWSFSTPLWYAQFVEGQRPDVFVADDRTRLDQGLGDAFEFIDRTLGQRPVYLIRLPYDMPPFRERYALTLLDGPSGGPVYRVDGQLGSR